MKYVLTLMTVNILIKECLPHTDGYKYPRIVGGRLAHIKDFSYQLCIVLKKTNGVGLVAFKGAATIVSKHWAMTASHCVDYISTNLFKSGFIYLRGNTSMWRTHKYYKDHKVIRSYMHRDYNKVTNDYDIALLKVVEPFNAKHEHPIKVAGKAYKYKDDSIATASGWGMTHDYQDDPVDRLRQVDIRLIGHQKCADIYENAQEAEFTVRMLCAWEKGKDACVYDSGGPLVQDNILIGVVSWGMRCASDTYPGVYVKLSEFYNWFKEFEIHKRVRLGIRFADGEE